MAWADILAKVPQTITSSRSVVLIAAASFDKLATEIADASNALVIWQGALEQFEIDVQAERARVTEHLSAAESMLADLRKSWDQRTEVRGVRGVLPAAVARADA